MNENRTVAAEIPENIENMQLTEFPPKLGLMSCKPFFLDLVYKIYMTKKIILISKRYVYRVILTWSIQILRRKLTKRINRNLRAREDCLEDSSSLVKMSNRNAFLIHSQICNIVCVVCSLCLQ